MTQPVYKVRTLRVDEFDDKLISAWHELESTAIEPNGYMSPNFVIPAASHLVEKDKVVAVLVEKESRGGPSQLSGLGIFHLSKPSRVFPLSHLTAFHSPHSFISGFLVDHNSTEDVLSHIFEGLKKFNNNRHALVIHNQLKEGISAELESEVTKNLGLPWETYRKWKRATLYPQQAKSELDSLINKSTKKSIARRMRKLEELGKVDWKVLYGKNLSQAEIERFMHLEHLGWKGKQKTSILSNMADTAFFMEMMENFGRFDQAFITELCVNEQVISSTANFVSGSAGFAFKIGWNPEYTRFSPGILNDCQWLKTDNQYINQLQFVDSGAAEDTSYISSLWPQQRIMQSGVYALTEYGKLVLPFVRIAANIKYSIKSKDKLKKELEN